jgi:hypothetical protein
MRPLDDTYVFRKICEESQARESKGAPGDFRRRMSLLLLSVVLPLDVACFSVAHCRRTGADCPRGCREAAILVVYLHARGVSA